jgi:hypothetical protein
MFRLKEDLEAVDNMNLFAFCRYVTLQKKFFDPHIKFA